MQGLLLLGAFVGVAWFGYRRLLKEADRVSKKVRQAEQERQTGAKGTLIEDPETGEYRLKRDDEE